MEQTYKSTGLTDIAEQLHPKIKSLWLRFVPLSLREGTVLEGGRDFMNGLYFLVDGSAELHLQLKQPVSMHVNYKSGSMPGSFLLFQPQHISKCHFHFTENSSLLFIEKSACFQLMGTSPEFAALVLEQVHAELNNLQLVAKLSHTAS